MIQAALFIASCNTCSCKVSGIKAYTPLELGSGLSSTRSIRMDLKHYSN
jgi:hypothetical protein